jgi:hypothetical protein
VAGAATGISRVNLRVARLFRLVGRVGRIDGVLTLLGENLSAAGVDDDLGHPGPRSLSSPS